MYTVLRQESPPPSPHLRFDKVANLFLSLPLALLLLLLLLQLLRIPFSPHVVVLSAERCAAFAEIQADITYFLQTSRARLLERANVQKKFISVVCIYNELTVAQFFIYFSFSLYVFCVLEEKQSFFFFSF